MAARTNFTLKKPDKKRRSFSILKRTIDDGKASYEKIENEALDAINKAYKDGKSHESCLILAKEVMASLYKELEKLNPKVVHNSANRELLNKFLKDEYEHRDLVDFESSKNDFRRAIEAVGSLSLYSATREELQKEIAKNFKSTKQRRIVARLNTLLKYINRDVKLRKDKKHQPEVAHLSHSDIKKMIKHITVNTEQPVNVKVLKLMAEVAFYTGCRTGEIFAITPISIRSNILLVQGQIDREGNNRDTKNRVKRKAFIIEEGRIKVKELTKHDLSSYRNLRFSDIIFDACKKAFPHEESKWITFHDLRHSYAIHLLSKGVSLSLVAQSLGNSITVCQENYAGFVLTDESISAIELILKKAK